MRPKHSPLIVQMQCTLPCCSCWHSFCTWLQRLHKITCKNSELFKLNYTGSRFMDFLFLWIPRQDKTSGRPRSRTEVEGNPKAPFSSCFYCNLRRLPQLTAGVGATPIPLHTQLVAQYWYSFYPPRIDGKLSELWSVRQWLSLEGHPSNR